MKNLDSTSNGATVGDLGSKPQPPAAALLGRILVFRWNEIKGLLYRFGILAGESIILVERYKRAVWLRRRIRPIAVQYLV